MAPAADRVVGPPSFSQAPWRKPPRHWAYVEAVQIYPDALRRLLQAAGEHSPTSQSSSSAVEIPQEVLQSAIILVAIGKRIHYDHSVSVHSGRLELQGRRSVPVAVRLYPAMMGPLDNELQLREMRIWSTLKHPRILPMLGHGKLDSRTAIIYPDWGAEINLQSYLGNNQQADRHRLIVQVAEGLQYLHNEQGIVHGDLNEASVFINAHGDAFLGRFTLSTCKSQVYATMTGIRAMHTVRYAAPEVMMGDYSAICPSKTKASDIYAFGMLVGMILSGDTLWSRRLTNFTVVFKVASGQHPPRPEEGQINDSMWALCEACWDHIPANRPSIAGILAGLRSSDPPERWNVRAVDEPDPADPSDLPVPEEHAESPPSVVPSGQLEVDEFPESTLRVELGGADTAIALPRQTPVRGGFGMVVRGFAELHGVPKILAVKICHGHKIMPHEYSIWKILSHKNILPLYGALELRDAQQRGPRECVFVSPYMNGGNLVGYLKLNPQVVRLPLLIDVAAGLEYLHNVVEIVHGDIKAENVLIADDGRAVLTDFGLSTTVSPGPQLSGSDVRNMYTLAYAAPEIVDDNAEDPDAPGVARSKTRMSDMYAYGVLLYQVYAGGLGRTMRARIQLIGAMHEGRLPKRPLGLMHCVLCDDLWSICKRCWERNATDRPQVAAVLGELKYLQLFPKRQRMETPEP